MIQADGAAVLEKRPCSITKQNKHMIVQKLYKGGLEVYLGFPGCSMSPCVKRQKRL